jgi:23S rRNA (cytosine1962-C5)-methyltransferase
MTNPKDPASPSAPPGPWVRLRSAAFTTFIFRRMIGEVSPDARPGDCVTVYDKHDAVFGHALYNPHSLIALRMLNFDDAPLDDAFWRQAVQRAASLRTGLLRLGDVTDAYRLIHAEGDDLSGLVVDRYADVLSVEVFSLGIWRRMPDLLPMLHEVTGTRHHLVRFDERAAKQEGHVHKHRRSNSPAETPEELRSENAPDSVNIVENGVRFRVEFAAPSQEETGSDPKPARDDDNRALRGACPLLRRTASHKTGFFCDQRDNRRRLAALVKDADVLDVCCYTGGFGLYAKTIGGAANVTCVDLDEQAVELAKRNANLNQVRVNLVHADAFSYMRQMQTNGNSYGAVVLDPPKLIFGRSGRPNSSRPADDSSAEAAAFKEGRNAYFDLNRLAASLVKPGGLLLTCSCSGALGRDEFLSLAVGAARQSGRRCQILDVTGAGPDHPVSPRCPESAYLKAAWLRLA